MKKNKMMRLASVMLVLTLLSTCAISGSFAKYTTTAEAHDTAVVAKWNVGAVLGSKPFGSEATTVDLFEVDKVYDGSSGLADPTDDADVRNGVSESNPIIAPGTWGKFTYTITNDSDVNAKYSVDYTVTAAGVPLEWSANGKDWSKTLSNISATEIKMPEAGKSATAVEKTVYWRWAYESGDTDDAKAKANEVDTALGAAKELASPSVKIQVTIEQAD